MERVRIVDPFSEAEENEQQAKQTIVGLQDHLRRLLEEGFKIVVE